MRSRVNMSPNEIKGNLLLALVFVIVIFCCSLGLTLKVMAPRYSEAVQIEATGEKNALSEGSGVGIAELDVGGREVYLDADLGDWRYSGKTLVWEGGSGNSIQFLVPIFSNAKITFCYNKWAGIVQVTTKEATETIDLYSPAVSSDSTYTYVISRLPIMRLVQKMWPVLLVLGAELILICLFAIALFIYFPIKLYPDDSGKRSLLMRLKKFARMRAVFLLRLAIVVISFIMMWHYAGEVSLWVDDIAAIEIVADDVSLSTNLQRLYYEARYNPPLFYVLGYFWLRIVPYGTKYLKLMNIILCCLGTWFCGTAAKKIRGNMASIFATILGASSIFMIDYAAYTFRCFGLVFLLCTLLILAYHRRLTYPDKISSHVIYGLLLAGVLYTNYLCGLVVAALGLFDFYLFVKKKIKLNCVLSYVGAGIAFLPLIIVVFQDMVESHAYFWPPVPDMNILRETILLIFSNSYLLVLLFLISFVLLACKNYFKNDYFNYEEVAVMQSLFFWFLFVIGFTYVFSKYIHPTGSIFVARYFICLLPVVIIIPAVGMDWILSALRLDRPGNAQKVLTITVVAGLYFSTAYKQFDSLDIFPGFINEPYEQAIDWIYSHENALSDDTLVMLAGGYDGGLYYYATHDGERDSLNFGVLTQDNWQSYHNVYASPMHVPFTDEVSALLSEHYVETERDDSLKMCVYTQIDGDQG